MYTRPSRRGATDGIADARVRGGPVGAHQGTLTDTLRRHEAVAIRAACGDVRVREEFLATIFMRTADTGNLRLAWDYLSQNCGQGPGADGLHYDDLGHHATWDLLRDLGRIIRTGEYRPGPDRIVEIQKSNGGTRTLRLPSVIDRTVQRAIVQTTQPFLDPQFSDNSYGFRPARGRTAALVSAQKLTESENRWVWLTADIRDAFGSVPQRRLLDVVQSYIPSKGLIRLIEASVVTETRRGLRQGSPLSPLLLNLYLDHHLDGPWHERHPDLPLIRYADDLLVVCRVVKEAEDAWNDLVNMLRPNALSLKGDKSEAVQDLRSGDNADWLGYQICRGESGLQTRISERNWKGLDQLLRECHSEPDAPLWAYRTILDWIKQQGPCRNWSNLGETYFRIASLAYDSAHEEIPPEGEIAEAWDHARDRYETILGVTGRGECRVCIG